MSDKERYQGTDKKAIRNIIDNYVKNEKALVDQLYFKACHGPTIGGFREDIWRGMFEQIVPKKFSIEQSVFIIDSEGRVSNEVDLAIFDETYTPYIFHYGRLKFIPIEAVAVVVECKSISPDKEDLKNWAESIAKLKTSKRSCVRTITEIAVGENKNIPTQTATRPIRILCRLNYDMINEKLSSGDKLFDIVVSASSAERGLIIEMDEAKKNLKSWYMALNHVDFQDKEDINKGANINDIMIDAYKVNNDEKSPVSLLTFNLQLNQILMLINNPILFPHIAYAEMFNTIGGGKDEQ